MLFVRHFAATLMAHGNHFENEIAPQDMTRFGRVVTASMIVATTSFAEARSPARPMVMPGGASLRLSQKGAATAIAYTMHRQTLTTTLPSEEGIYAGSLMGAQLLGAIDSSVAIITADYSSNPSGGAFQCGAGIETVIRVIALLPRPHQTFAQRVASCWTAIDPGDTSWDAAGRTLTIERTTYEHAPKGNEMVVQDLRTTYRVAPTGTVETVRVERLP